VALDLTQIVTELAQAIGVGGKLNAGENGLVDLFGGPASRRAGMEETTCSNRMMRVSWILIPEADQSQR
jgi:hypothetical protein